jgi:hypothetical protein
MHDLDAPGMRGCRKLMPWLLKLALPALVVPGIGLPIHANDVS